MSRVLEFTVRHPRRPPPPLPAAIRAHIKPLDRRTHTECPVSHSRKRREREGIYISYINTIHYLSFIVFLLTCNLSTSSSCHLHVIGSGKRTSGQCTESVSRGFLAPHPRRPSSHTRSMPATPPLASRAAPRASVDLVRTVAPGLPGAEQRARPSGNTRTCAVSLLDPAPRPAAWMPPPPRRLAWSRPSGCSSWLPG